jgi:hypothetical protein
MISDPVSDKAVFGCYFVFGAWPRVLLISFGPCRFLLPHPIAYTNYTAVYARVFIFLLNFNSYNVEHVGYANGGPLTGQKFC